ncbi:hypothetical protein D3C87_1590830 [compost metagenome]
MAAGARRVQGLRNRKGPRRCLSAEAQRARHQRREHRPLQGLQAAGRVLQRHRPNQKQPGGCGVSYLANADRPWRTRLCFEGHRRAGREHLSAVAIGHRASARSRSSRTASGLRRRRSRHREQSRRTGGSSPCERCQLPSRINQELENSQGRWSTPAEPRGATGIGGHRHR